MNDGVLSETFQRAERRFANDWIVRPPSVATIDACRCVRLFHGVVVHVVSQRRVD